MGWGGSGRTNGRMDVKARLKMKVRKSSSYFKDDMARYARWGEYAAPLCRVSFWGCRGSVVVTRVVNSSYCAAEKRKTPRNKERQY